MMPPIQVKTLLSPIREFLQCETPQAWLDVAQQPEQLSIILFDHLLCELKAAQTAIMLLRKYAVTDDSAQQLLQWIQPYEALAYQHIGNLDSLKGQNLASKQLNLKPHCTYAPSLVDKLVLLIKEELHHFYQVLEIITARGMTYHPVEASRYAKGLIAHVKTYEPAALIDKLIIGALIEARSCERFAMLAPYMDETLQNFYLSLLRSEARHFKDYLLLAEDIAQQDISARVAFLAQQEAMLIQSKDTDFKFHSGVPAHGTTRS